MQAPTYADILAARKFISAYLPKTPLVRSHKLSEALGCDYYLNGRFPPLTTPTTFLPLN